MTDSPARLAYIEAFSHSVALELLDGMPHIAPRRLQLDWPESQLWSEFEAAHVYQIRATRSELPGQFFANAAFLARAPSLLAVSTNGSGADTVDIDACTAAGVLVVNQAGGNAQAVAEHALGMMLCLSKRIIEADRAVRTVEGLARESLMGHDMHGRTLGIIGLGNIGQRLAALARGVLQMTILAYDPFIDEAQFEAHGARRCALDELLSQADFVSVHCPRNAHSEGMLDARAFSHMRPHAFFVNTARGGIHDEMALADVLARGGIAGAGLDVWEHEPPPLDHPLLRFDNVIVSPHTAGVTHEARRNMARNTIAQIDEIVRARRAPRILNPEVWPQYCDRFESLRGVRPQ